MNNKKQPLSPHLTVYKPQITSIMSISHRITGFFQTIGTIIIFVYILALFIGEGFYNYIDFFITSLLGKIFVYLYCRFKYLNNLKILEYNFISIE